MESIRDSNLYNYSNNELKRTKTEFNGYYNIKNEENDKQEYNKNKSNNIEITKTTTWNDIKQNKNISNIEHPLYASIITKQEFEKEFSNLLLKLNGESIDKGPPTPDCYFGFFVEINPVDSTLKFIDEDSKTDFIDWAIELGIMPPLKEIHQSESIQDQENRKKEDGWESIKKLDNEEVRKIEREIALQKQEEDQKSREIQKKKSFDRTESRSQFYKDYMLLISFWKGYKKNNDLLQKETKDNKIAKLNKKITSSLIKIKEFFQTFTKNYPLKEMSLYEEFNEDLKKNIVEIKTFIESL